MHMILTAGKDIAHYPNAILLVSRIFAYYRLKAIRLLSSFYRVLFRRKIVALDVPIKCAVDDMATPVDLYWSEHTVNSDPFTTRWESDEYYKWLIFEYPLLEELMDFNVERAGSVALDYGCGPGNDIYRLLIRNKAGKVLGMDISRKALELARRRMALYRIDPARLELIDISDSDCRIPIEDGSIDYLNCAGVLHHTSSPEEILAQFARVMKPGASGHIMVYNRDSIYYHLYVAYCIMIVRDNNKPADIDEVFSRSTDGEECPLSRCYSNQEFVAICRQAGLGAEFIGGYFILLELQLLKKFGRAAAGDDRLGAEHKEFLRDLQYDTRGFPLSAGKHAGIGGVYKIRKL